MNTRCRPDSTVPRHSRLALLPYLCRPFCHCWCSLHTRVRVHVASCRAPPGRGFPLRSCCCYHSLIPCHAAALGFLGVGGFRDVVAVFGIAALLAIPQLCRTVVDSVYVARQVHALVGFLIPLHFESRIRCTPKHARAFGLERCIWRRAKLELEQNTSHARQAYPRF